jgi:hypothetical protein
MRRKPIKRNFVILFEGKEKRNPKRGIHRRMKEYFFFNSTKELQIEMGRRKEKIREKERKQSKKGKRKRKNKMTQGDRKWRKEQKVNKIQ